MPFPNSRSAYSFDGSTRTDPNTGGLPALLQQVLLQQMFQRPSSTGDASQMYSNFELPDIAQQDVGSPRTSNSASTDELQSQDQNFRQLVSRPAAPATRAFGSAQSDFRPVPAVMSSQVPATTDRSNAIWSDFEDGATPIPVALDRDYLRNPYPRVFGEGGGGGAAIVATSPLWRPKPRDEDASELWKAIQRAWQNLMVRKSRGRGVVRSPPLQPTGRESQEIYEPTDHTLSDYPKCNRQYLQDIDECNSREGAANSRWRSNCFAHAMKRRLACEANDGNPDLMVPPFR